MFYVLFVPVPYAVRGQESDETAISGKETTNTKISGLLVALNDDSLNTADIILIVYVYDEQGMSTRYATDYYLRINPLTTDCILLMKRMLLNVFCNLVKKVTEDAEQTSATAIFGSLTSVHPQATESAC